MLETSTALQYGFTRRNHAAASALFEGVGATGGAGGGATVGRTGCGRTTRGAGVAARGRTGAAGRAVIASAAQIPA